MMTLMTERFLDECLLFTVPPVAHSDVLAEEGMMKIVVRLHGMAGVLVDDALLTGNASLAVVEQAMHARFESTTSTGKEMSELTYAGATIIQSNPPGTVTVVQKSYIANLAIPEQHDWDFCAVRTYSGRLSWLATVTRPDMSDVVAQLAQVTAAASHEELKKCLRVVKDTVSFLHDTAEVRLVFPKLTGSMRLVCYADASFAGNVDHSSQLGCLLMFLDSENNTHILNWFSRKSARVTVSILTAETLAVTAAVDAAYAVHLQLAQMGIDAELDVLTDSKQLYTALQGHGKVTEQRLMTDVAALRQVLRKNASHSRRLCQIAV
jgi:hypothetical protein